MADFDLIIRNGTVVDGTGFPRYRSDLAIRDGRVAQIGGLRRSSAAREFDATGLIVAPGFVDLHTHYDGQIQWDPYCTVSGWHGVTSVAIGNCGFGFAPVRPEERDRAMLMMSRNEAIPLESLRAGMIWDWTTFPDWLDTLDRIPKGVNCLTYLPVSPLIIGVMGLEAAKSRPATEKERREMQRLLHEAMEAGACGFSVQRMGEHSMQADFDGTPMPTDKMADEDLLALAEVLRERDEGFIQITQATFEEVPSEETALRDLAFQERLAEVSGRPILHNAISALDHMPEFHRMRMAWIEDCNRRGLRLFGQAAHARFHICMTLDHWNMYDTCPAWNHATTGTLEDKKRKLADPAVRARMIAEEHMIVTDILGGPLQGLRVQRARNHPELARYLGKTVGEIAEAEGKHPLHAMLDLALAGDLEVEFRTPQVFSADAEKVAEMLRSPYVIPGVSDGGAHVRFFPTGTFTTDMLAWLVRDTGKLTLEGAHYHMSHLPAQAAGFRDRGTLREGAPADVVVYDLAKLRLVPEDEYEIAHDLPAGEWRRIQRAEGYRWILVNGQVTFEEGRCTGATPGKLLRHGRG